MATPDKSADFSFDLYAGLDAELEAALARNVEKGTATAATLATAGLAAAVGNTLQQPDPNRPGVLPEVWQWAESELTAGLARCIPFGKIAEMPGDVEYLRNNHHQFEATINRLYAARQTLEVLGDNTPDNGEKVADTMSLALVPWQGFKNNLRELPAALQAIRNIQGAVSSEDYINESLLEAITNDTKLYRNPENDPQNPWLSAEEYLDQRIAQDGDWGIMLAQVSNDAGMVSLKGKSPDELTDNGQKNLTIRSVDVGAMGVFEWLAVTIQQDPRKLSSQDYSWLLANRFTDDSGVARVPYGSFDDGRVWSNRSWAGYQGDDIRPRLAVI